MFKSVFAKYVAAFILVILLSFAVILATVSSIIVAYSESAKTDVMLTAARASAALVEGELGEGSDSLENIEERRWDPELCRARFLSVILFGQILEQFNLKKFCCGFCKGE